MECVCVFVALMLHILSWKNNTLSRLQSAPCDSCWIFTTCREMCFDITNWVSKGQNLLRSAWEVSWHTVISDGAQRLYGSSSLNSAALYTLALRRWYQLASIQGYLPLTCLTGIHFCTVGYPTFRFSRFPQFSVLNWSLLILSIFMWQRSHIYSSTKSMVGQ